ncbi:MAG: hypothetical protein IJ752_07520 [Alphaproteobacteria bacterium]|nr:hypothetical protein [Alphaproteobacteria bacterium]
MKKISIIFLLLLLYPQQGFSRAQCPANTTQESCCDLKGELTLSDCNSRCSGTCKAGYYAGCYTCSGNSSISIPFEEICYAGTYKNNGTCAQCKPGTYSDEDEATACKPCPAGTKQNMSGETYCDSCHDGDYASGTGNTTCSRCPAGTTSEDLYKNDIDSSIETNLYANGWDGGVGATRCIPCPAGYYGSGGICDKCPAGTYASGPGNTSCTPCPSGQTSDEGASSCTTSYCSMIPDYNCYTIDEDLYVGWGGQIGEELCEYIYKNNGTMFSFVGEDPTGSVRSNHSCPQDCSKFDIADGTCTSCSSTACLSVSCDKEFIEYNGKCIWESFSLVKQNSDGSRYQSSYQSRNGISAYYSYTPDLTIYDAYTKKLVTYETDTVVMQCFGNGLGDFWTMEECEKHIPAGYYCALTHFSCPVTKEACMKEGCDKCTSDGSCQKCNSDYTFENGECKLNRVGMCPPDATLSSDKCCCVY